MLNIQVFESLALGISSCIKNTPAQVSFVADFPQNGVSTLLRQKGVRTRIVSAASDEHGLKTQRTHWKVNNLHLPMVSFQLGQLRASLEDFPLDWLDEKDPALWMFCLESSPLSVRVILDLLSRDVESLVSSASTLCVFNFVGVYGDLLRRISGDNEEQISLRSLLREGDVGSVLDHFVEQLTNVKADEPRFVFAFEEAAVSPCCYGFYASLIVCLPDVANGSGSFCIVGNFWLEAF